MCYQTTKRACLEHQMEYDDYSINNTQGNQNITDLKVVISQQLYGLNVSHNVQLSFSHVSILRLKHAIKRKIHWKLCTFNMKSTPSSSPSPPPKNKNFNENILPSCIFQKANQRSLWQWRQHPKHILTAYLIRLKQSYINGPICIQHVVQVCITCR